MLLGAFSTVTVGSFLVLSSSDRSVTLAPLGGVPAAAA
jgi:hypothetical protein